MTPSEQHCGHSGKDKRVARSSSNVLLMQLHRGFVSRRGLSKVTSTCLTWSSDFVIWFSCCLSMQRWTSLGFTNCWPHIILQTLLADFMVPSSSSALQSLHWSDWFKWNSNQTRLWLEELTRRWCSHWMYTSTRRGQSLSQWDSKEKTTCCVYSESKQFGPDTQTKPLQ